MSAPSDVKAELEDLERRAWEALSGAGGAAFYETVMADDGVMVFRERNRATAKRRRCARVRGHHDERVRHPERMADCSWISSREAQHITLRLTAWLRRHSQPGFAPQRPQLLLRPITAPSAALRAASLARTAASFA